MSESKYPLVECRKEGNEYLIYTEEELNPGDIVKVKGGGAHGVSYTIRVCERLRSELFGSIWSTMRPDFKSTYKSDE